MPRMFSDDQVREIRAMYEETAMLPVDNPERKSYKDIGLKFNTNPATIHRIVTKQTYKDVT